MSDLISKAALLAEFDLDDKTVFDTIGIRYYIQLTPTVEVVSTVYGKWEILEEVNCVDTYGNPSKYAKCTNCGFMWSDLYSVKKYFKSCPNCGVKMDDIE